MGSGREGLPSSPIGEGRVERTKRKSGGGIDKEKLPDLHENNVSEINDGPIGLDLGNAGTLRVSATDPPSNRLLSPKTRVACVSRVNSFDSKQQNQQQQARRNPKRSSSMPKLEDKQVDEGSVVGRRRRRTNMTEGRERSSLNGNLNEERIKEELKSPSEIKKTKSPKISSRTEVIEEIGLQQPNGSPPSRSERSTQNFLMEALVTEGGDLRLVDTGPSIRHKRKVPEPNAHIPQIDLQLTLPQSISPISQLGPEPNYPHAIVPNPHLSPDAIYPDPIDSHLVPPISLTALEPIDAQPNPPIPQIFPDPVDPQPNPPVSLDFPEPIDNPPNPAITHLVSHKSTDLHPIIYKETSVQAPVPTKNLTSLQRRSPKSTDPHRIIYKGTSVQAPVPTKNLTCLQRRSPKSTDPHPIIYKETSVQAPVPTKNLTCQQRRSRRTYRESSEGVDRIQYMVDLIMWEDTPKSALMFGLGSFCVLSSSFTQDLHFSVVTFVSYLALVYLAAVFFYKNILQRGVQQDCSPVNYEAISEAYALSIVRLVLPFVNGLLVKFRELFSGDPATTMKLASIIWLLAQCGQKMTIWTLAKLSFFAIFTIPKLYACYSVQLHRYGHFMLCRFWDAWNTCSHKKGVLVTVFLLVWNLSTVTARVWGAFILIVALRLYQQSVTTDLVNQNVESVTTDLVCQNVDHSEESIQNPETQLTRIA
jgi:hypothetical protein